MVAVAETRGRDTNRTPVGVRARSVDRAPDSSSSSGCMKGALGSCPRYREVIDGSDTSAVCVRSLPRTAATFVGGRDPQAATDRSAQFALRTRLRLCAWRRTSASARRSSTVCPTQSCCTAGAEVSTELVPDPGDSTSRKRNRRQSPWRRAEDRQVCWRSYAGLFGSCVPEATRRTLLAPGEHRSDRTRRQSPSGTGSTWRRARCPSR